MDDNDDDDDDNNDDDDDDDDDDGGSGCGGGGVMGKTFKNLVAFSKAAGLQFCNNRFLFP